MKSALSLALLACSAAQLSAQSVSQMIAVSAAPIVAQRFGLWLNEQYVGNLGWTHTSGDSDYSADATLRNGKLHCSATARSPEGTFTTTGPGLIEITLGEDPDPEDEREPGAPPIPAGSKMYIVRAACPHPRSSTPQVPNWNDEYSSYKQVGGKYDATVNASGIVVRSLPAQLKGQWQATLPEETRSMKWNLCHKDWTCPGIN